MERREKYEDKLKIYEKALINLKKSLEISTLNFSPDLIDIIKNGRIQKFEYCVELTWKVIKNYLLISHNIDTYSPRQVIKEFFLLKKISQTDYETLLNVLEDRNKLSHIYNELFFNEIHDRLKNYLVVMTNCLAILKDDKLNNELK